MNADAAADDFAAAVVVLLLLTTTPALGERGLASVYCEPGKTEKVASGGRCSPHRYTAAHRKLPFGTCVEVSKGPLAVVVAIDDRGPYVPGRIIDVTPIGARAIDLDGLAEVSIRVVPCR